MGYLHIDNLYANQEVLMFKEVFCLEKIHGSSSHVAYLDKTLNFFSGGANHETFLKCFKHEELLQKFQEHAQNEFPITVYGEVYGGKMQGMSGTYGKEMKFIAFDVKVGNYWLSVPQAADFVKNIGLEFVPYIKVNCTLEAIDRERDADSIVAIQNGCGTGQKREGIVIRPPIEVTKNNGNRIIAKHKRDEFKETKTPRKVVDLAQLEVLTDADRIADEFVTMMRLEHIVDKMKQNPDEILGPQHISKFIPLMVEDILREGKKEIAVDSKEVRKAISKKAANLFQTYLKNKLVEV